MDKTDIVENMAMVDSKDKVHMLASELESRTRVEVYLTILEMEDIQITK